MRTERSNNYDIAWLEEFVASEVLNPEKERPIEDLIIERINQLYSTKGDLKIRHDRMPWEFVVDKDEWGLQAWLSRNSRDYSKPWDGREKRDEELTWAVECSNGSGGESFLRVIRSQCSNGFLSSTEEVVDQEGLMDLFMCLPPALEEWGVVEKEEFLDAESPVGQIGISIYKVYEFLEMRPEFETRASYLQEMGDGRLLRLRFESDMGRTIVLECLGVSVGEVEVDEWGRVEERFFGVFDYEATMDQLVLSLNMAGMMQSFVISEGLQLSGLSKSEMLAINEFVKNVDLVMNKSVTRNLQES